MEWLPYEFKWKPGDVDQPPHWVAPHQPRLDWQMWFAALGTYRQNPWFVRLTKELLENNPDVTSLAGAQSLSRTSRRALSAPRFTNTVLPLSAEHRATGAWWKREESGEYLPAVSLKDFSAIRRPSRCADLFGAGVASPATDRARSWLEH